jgi:hypothetical protein
MQPETLIYYQGVGGATTEDVMAAIDAGTGIVNYRGWSNWQGWHRPEFYRYHVTQLENGHRLPVMFSICCGTGDFWNLNDPCLGEAWIRAGSPSNPKGGPAFFGVSDSWTHTKWNNAINIGIFDAMVDRGIRTFRSACLGGLMELMIQFPRPDEDSIWRYFHTYNVIGDPSLQMWMDVPEEMSVDFPASVSLGGSMVEVSLEDGSRAPVEGAYVCLWKGDEVFSGDVTESDGVALLPADPSTEGDLLVTVTAPDFVPFEDTIDVEQRGIYVGLSSFDLDDSPGNGDGTWNPGEDILLDVTLENFGNGGTASSVIATLRCNDTLIGIEDSVETFGDLAPGESASSSDPYEFSIGPMAPTGAIFDLQLVIESEDSTWFSLIELEVRGFEPEFVSYSVDDPGGDGYLDPGETGDLFITVENVSSEVGGESLTGLLRSRYTGVVVHESTAVFGDLPIGETATNATPFELEVMPDATHGRKVPLDLYLTDVLGGTRKVTFNFRLGEPETTDPTGPDAYGYWAYDHTDTGHDEAPTYDWVEIDPDHGGEGTELPVQEDSVVVLELPFDFPFYGESQETLTVSLNGWIAFTETDLFSPRNWRIPSAPGPENLVAVFWDELKEDSVGGVYYWHDTSDHRFVVEWSEVPNMHGENPIETFEVILFDPDYYPTETGDGELLFQYHTVNNVDESHYYATVGIENRDHTWGLEYCYGDIYRAGAHPLEDELAIRFTTDAPDTYTTDIREDELPAMSLGFSLLQNRPNPWRGSTDISFALPVEGSIRLQVYDISGRLVRTLGEGRFPAGFNSVTWDGLDDRGVRVVPGIYFYRLGLRGEFRTKKMIMLR